MGKSYWMKDDDQNGNFTNDKKDAFDPKKRYIGVRLQQGVPLLDRDWNELEDIRRYEEMITRREYIGNGSPDDGFKISACEPPENNFIIGTGRCMVDGFEVVNDPELYDNSVRSYTDQKRIDENIPDLKLTENSECTVYLDVWVNEVRSQGNDDPLNNPQDLNEETTIRHKLMWCVRVREGTNSETVPQCHHYYDLARIKIKEQGKIQATDIEDLREGRGKDKLTIKSLTFKNVQVQPKEWPKLTCEAANQVNLSGDLIIPSGKVGIGTDNPKWDLDVSAEFIKLGLEKRGGGQLLIVSGKDEDAIYLEAYSSKNKGTASKLVITGNANSNNIPVLYLNANKTIFNGLQNKPGKLEVHGDINSDANLVIDGNVGIGTTTPSFKLNIDPKGAGGILIGNPNTSSGGYTSLIMEISQEKDGHALLDCLKSSGSSGGDICLNTRGRNVGIGTTEPLGKLDVKGSIHAGNSDIYFTEINHKHTGFGNKEGYAAIENDSFNHKALMILGRQVDNKRIVRLWDYLQVNGNMDITGNVGIGTTEPKDKLDVNGNIRLSGKLAFQESDGYLRINQNNDFRNGTHFNRRANFRSGITTGTWWDKEPGEGNILVQGNVGIGTIAPFEKLEVNGNIKVSGQIFQETWKFVGSIDFKDNWVNYGYEYNPASYFLDKNGIVHLRGLVKDGEIGLEKVIFILPEGYRPAYRELHTVASNTSNNGTGRCDILPSGEVRPMTGNAGWFSLDGITFRAAQITKCAYIANYGSNTISVIDTANNNVIVDVPVGSHPDRIVVTPDGTQAYVRIEGAVSVIDTAKNIVIKTLPAGSDPEEGVFTLDGRTMYVPSYQNNKVNVIEIATKNVITTVDVGRGPYGIAMTPDGTKVYVANSAEDTVSVISTSTNKVLTTVKVKQKPYGVAVTPDGNKVYVTIEGWNCVFVIDTINNTVIRELNGFSLPWGIIVTPDGKKAYVANYGNGTFSVIDTETDIVTATVSIGSYPRGVAVNPKEIKV